MGSSGQRASPEDTEPAGSASNAEIALSYVVPAHNSAGIIAATLDLLGRRLTGTSAEILVVENGSRDSTAQVLEDLSRTWVHPGVDLRVLRSEQGLGHAYRQGLAASRGRRVVLTADDLPFGFDDVDAAEHIDPDRYPVVIGSKGHPESVVERGAVRAIMTWGFAVLRRWILGVRTRDPQGTFVLHGEWARRINEQLTEPGYLISTELCYLAERSGVIPLEVPIRLSATHDQHSSRIRARDVWQMGIGLVAIRRRHSNA